MTPEPQRTEAKPTKAEVRRRIDITESLLIDCGTVTDTVRYFAEKEGLQLGRRTVERYREIAEARIAKAAEPIRENERQKAKLRLERCFARAMSGSKKNVFAAIAAQKGINNLIGLNAPKYGEEEMSIEELARQTVIQRKEMERQLNGEVGLIQEISDLFERYRSLGKDPDGLLRSLAQRLKLPNDPTANS